MMTDIPTILIGTTMQAYYSDKTNELISYKIIPEEGYVIHHKSLDIEIFDEETHEPTGEIQPGFSENFIMIHKNYNFVENVDDIYTIKKEEIMNE